MRLLVPTACSARAGAGAALSAPEHQPAAPAKQSAGWASPPAAPQTKAEQLVAQHELAALDLERELAQNLALRTGNQVREQLLATRQSMEAALEVGSSTPSLPNRLRRCPAHCSPAPLPMPSGKWWQRAFPPALPPAHCLLPPPAARPESSQPRLAHPAPRCIAQQLSRRHRHAGPWHLCPRRVQAANNTAAADCSAAGGGSAEAGGAPAPAGKGSSPFLRTVLELAYWQTPAFPLVREPNDWRDMTELLAGAATAAAPPSPSAAGPAALLAPAPAQQQQQQGQEQQEQQEEQLAGASELPAYHMRGSWSDPLVASAEHVGAVMAEVLSERYSSSASGGRSQPPFDAVSVLKVLPGELAWWAGRRPPGRPFWAAA